MLKNWSLLILADYSQLKSFWRINKPLVINLTFSSVYVDIFTFELEES